MSETTGEHQYPKIPNRGMGMTGRVREIMSEAEALLATPLNDDQRERLWRIEAAARALAVHLEEGLEPARAARTPQARKEPENLRVLLVEDNPFNQELMTRLMTFRGHRVTVAENRQETLDALEREAFDLVLMDLRMPELDGLRVSAAIREREQQRGGHIPIVAVTALVGEQDQQRAREAGIDCFHPKPVKADQLFAEITQLLERGCPGAPARTRHAPAPPPAAPPAPEQELVDLERVLSSVDGDWSLLREIVELYFSEAPRQMGQLKELIRDGNAEMVREVAHSLKGASGAFGKGLVYHQALSLEQVGRTGDLSGAEALWNQLEQGLGRMKAELERIMEQGGVE